MFGGVGKRGENLGGEKVRIKDQNLGIVYVGNLWGLLFISNFILI